VKGKKFILWFDEIGSEMFPCGGRMLPSEKCIASSQPGIHIPNGFAISAYAYRYFLRYAGLKKKSKNFEGP
jgi:pyruvate,water dikinase